MLVAHSTFAGFGAASPDGEERDVDKLGVEFANCY